MHSGIPSQHRHSPDFQGTSHDVCADVDSQVACTYNVGKWCVGNMRVFNHQASGLGRDEQGSYLGHQEVAMRVEDEVLEARHAR